MTKNEALRLALEYVELVPDDRYSAEHIDQDALITAIKAALEANDEPVVWGASSMSKPEYIAEQKAKTKELRNMMDEAVQTVPNFDQLQQIVNNLERCLTRDSKHEFLRVWIRDWTEHKLSKHTPPQRTWVGLTDEEIAEALGDEIDSVYMTDFRRVEAKLKEKNNG